MKNARFFMTEDLLGFFYDRRFVFIFCLLHHSCFTFLRLLFPPLLYCFYYLLHAFCIRIDKWEVLKLLENNQGRRFVFIFADFVRFFFAYFIIRVLQFCDYYFLPLLYCFYYLLHAFCIRIGKWEGAKTFGK